MLGEFFIHPDQTTRLEGRALNSASILSGEENLTCAVFYIMIICQSSFSVVMRVKIQQYTTKPLLRCRYIV